MSNRRYINPEMTNSGFAAQIPTITQTNAGAPNVITSQPKQVEISFPWANNKLLNPESPQGYQQFPQYFRLVSSIFPGNKEIAAQCKIPFGLIVNPGLVEGVPEIDCSNSTVVRCESCMGYLCPQCKVAPDGRSWICPLCGKANPIISNTYAMDFASRPEFAVPVYDVIAPQTYVQKKSGPLFLFLIDMSTPSCACGLTAQMLTSIKASIPSIPDNYKVGLMTMGYNVSVFDLVTKSEIVIADTEEVPFSISLKNIFPTKAECADTLSELIDTLLERIGTEQITGHCLGSALVVVEQLLQNIGGVLIAGFTRLPTYGISKLKPRQGSELSLLRLPADGSGKLYRDMAFKLNRAGVSVHYFTAGTEFEDLSTTAVPCGLTCGKCHHYGELNEKTCAKMHSDIYNTITDSYCWDSTLRLRCSNGIKLVRPHTNCVLRTDLVSFPVIASEDSIAFELGIESSITTALFQLAFIFTDTNCRRIIRVFTFVAPTSTRPMDVWNYVDEATLAAILERRSITEFLSSGTEGAIQIKKQLTQLLKPGIPFVSLFHLMHSLTSSTALRASPNPLGVDGRMSEIIGLRSIGINDLLLYLYPRMFATDSENIVPLPLTGESFGYGNCFLTHKNDKIYIWISQNVSPQYLQNTFGASSLETVPETVPTLDTKENKALQELIRDCWSLSCHFLPTEIITQGSPREAIFGEILVDDSAASGAPLNQWMKEIRSF